MALLPPDLEAELRAAPARWLVTGAAGFIGSNLLEALLRTGQHVTGIDNFSTGFRRNLDEVHALVGDEAWSRFRFVEGDVCDTQACALACDGIDFVLHQAALGSVPRSIEQPLNSFDSNVSGFVRMLAAARDAGVRRFVYASSSSVYGDSEVLPKVEHQVGRPLSPYAATKAADELFADVFARTYSLGCIGLRYFNVFGPRQDPDGAYAAVIPRWIAAQLHGDACRINGDGQTSRDFCFVANAVQANVRAAMVPFASGMSRVYNVACGARTTLNELHDLIAECLAQAAGRACTRAPEYVDFRAGDVRHSLADITRARGELGFLPTHDVREGLRAAMDWYVRRSRREQADPRA